MYAGIDYDTFAVHVVLIEDGRPELYVHHILEGDDPFERARQVREVMPSRGWWLDEGVIAIAIEEQNSNNPKVRASVQKLKMIQGAILSCLPRSTLVVPMNGPEWRKALGIPGNAPKEAVREWAIENGYAALYARDVPQDAADAFCLARAAEARTAPARA